MEMKSSRRRLSAFTLIELLVVIVIIAVLMGLAFPVFQGIQNQAKKTQAKNDLTQIVTAVNAFYTEYGKYPLATDDTFFSSTSDLLNTLRALGNDVTIILEKLFSFLRAMPKTPHNRVPALPRRTLP